MDCNIIIWYYNIGTISGTLKKKLKYITFNICNN